MPDIENKSSDRAGMTKWIVIGVVLIVLILVLKDPLSNLVNKTEELHVDLKGNITLKTTKSAIGELKVSSETVSSQEAAKIAEKATSSDKTVVEGDFMLSWPKETWMRDDAYIPTAQAFQDQLGSGLKIVLYCKQKVMNELGGNSNVAVSTLFYDNSYSWSQQVASLKQGMEQGVNAKFLTYEVDEESKGATLIYTFQYEGIGFYQIQRCGYKNGKVIIAGATTFIEDKQTQAEINEIMNSFRIVS